MLTEGLIKHNIVKSTKFNNLYEISLDYLKDNSTKHSITNTFDHSYFRPVIVSTTYQFDEIIFASDGCLEIDDFVYMIHHINDNIIYLDLLSYPISKSPLK
ncbi:hypothetical protein [Empedobacter sp. GD03797]|uniref:hypothetical protein n=1 Tax=Empedobacter sp. GD03797 TaxID=2975382 RepID=UPI00244C78E6|nr:hypothetical protein [Empedobacter sp. GD03797]MDH1884203.1 hypothetical protein [Empedobacter sp. GD03797]